jgi:hypothetical protein
VKNTLSKIFSNLFQDQLFVYKSIKSMGILIILMGINSSLYAQIDSLKMESIKDTGKGRKISKLPYFMDDLMIIGGLNRSGLYFSDNFRDLSYGSGFQLGIEGFLPLGNITFFDYGIQYAQRNFKHDSNDILFKNHFLEFPIYVSFALPELRRIDWRFFLGTQLTYRLSSSQSGSYVLLDSNTFTFDPQRFKRLDGGMTFGLSAEANDIYMRVRSFVGVNNLDRNDQGAMNAFYIEVGYFLFRKYR